MYQAEIPPFRNHPEDAARLGVLHGCADGMKTAVSIPDQIFQDSERLAAVSGISRSRLYTLALQKYLARQPPNALSEAMNRVCDQVGDTRDPFVLRAAET